MPAPAAAEVIEPAPTAEPAPAPEPSAEQPDVPVAEPEPVAVVAPAPAEPAPRPVRSERPPVTPRVEAPVVAEVAGPRRPGPGGGTAGRSRPRRTSDLIRAAIAGCASHPAAGRDRDRPHRCAGHASRAGHRRCPGRRSGVRTGRSSESSALAHRQADSAATGPAAFAIGSPDPAPAGQRSALGRHSSGAGSTERPTQWSAHRWSCTTRWSPPRRRRVHPRQRPPRRRSAGRSRWTWRSRWSRWSGFAAERPASPAAPWTQPSSSPRPRGAAAAVHQLHAQRRAGPRGDHRHRTRRLRPGVRSQAQPYGSRRRALPAQQRRDGHGHDDPVGRPDGAVRPRDRRRDPPRRTRPAGRDRAASAVRRQRRRGEPAAAGTGGHRDGSRRPWQDHVARQDPLGQRRRRRGRWHHPAHRCLPSRPG